MKLVKDHLDDKWGLRTEHHVCDVEYECTYNYKKRTLLSNEVYQIANITYVIGGEILPEGASVAIPITESYKMPPFFYMKIMDIYYIQMALMF